MIEEKETMSTLLNNVSTLEEDDESLRIIRKNVEGRCYIKTDDFSREVKRLTRVVPIEYLSKAKTVTHAVALWIKDKGDEVGRKKGPIK